MTGPVFIICSRAAGIFYHFGTFLVELSKVLELKSSRKMAEFRNTHSVVAARAVALLVSVDLLEGKLIISSVLISNV